MKKKVITVTLLLSVLMTCSITPTFASADIENTQNLPNKAIVFFNTQDVGFDKNITNLQQAGWQTVNTSKIKVTWKKGVAAAVVCATLATACSVTSATMALAIPANILAVLAASSIGGTVNLKEQVLYQQIGVPLRRYNFTIKDSEGKTNGPYYINMPRPRSAENEMVEN